MASDWLGSCLGFPEKSTGPNSHASLCFLENHQQTAHFNGRGSGGNLGPLKLIKHSNNVDNFRLVLTKESLDCCEPCQWVGWCNNLYHPVQFSCLPRRYLSTLAGWSAHAFCFDQELWLPKGQKKTLELTWRKDCKDRELTSVMCSTIVSEKALMRFRNQNHSGRSLTTSPRFPAEARNVNVVPMIRRASPFQASPPGRRSNSFLPSGGGGG